MCGIAGLLDFNSSPDQENLEKMLFSIKHRGPDSKGDYRNNFISMGMQRLSIIDIDGGDQPISNHEKNVFVICNGEIYNYLELRNDLIKKGYRFKTKSDTEVLVHLYKEYGKNMFSYLNGMFAFAIWDDIKKKLILCRDRMGIKPLYYYFDGSRLIFSSESKSILLHDYVDKKIDKQSLADYLMLGYVPRENTLYSSIKKLLPGEYIEYKPQKFSISSWWKLEDYSQIERFGNVKDRTEEFVELFKDSISLRMRSDVPVASFLSGGLDSTLITLISNEIANYKLNTYNIKYDNAVFDESPFANDVARICNSNHNQLIINKFDMINELPTVLWHIDNPSADPTVISQYLISQAASEDVKVSLSGLGGDELFGGYQHYIDFKDGRGRIKNLIGENKNIARIIAPLFKQISSSAYNVLKVISDPGLLWSSHLPRLNQGYFNQVDLIDLGIDTELRYETIFEELWRSYPGNDTVGQRQFIDLKTYIPDQLLMFTDKLSMANSLEVRVPFLDHRIVSFASAIPGSLKNDKLDHDNFKQFLKSSFSDIIPNSIKKRKKMGFVPPIVSWLKNKDFIDLINNLPNQFDGILDLSFLKKIGNDKDLIVKNHKKIWSLITLASWFRLRENNSNRNRSIKELIK
ncbi:MAG: asparagine synthase (glutamine-hydrolyzing) [Candidatus Marinimicrobia bacterium]|nr:asparagine synthase (glutamine-hydrolyzing) [Candidatus Neomarinimicrobiota bacterium]